MKKLVSLALCLIFILLPLAACSKAEQETPPVVSPDASSPEVTSPESPSTDPANVIDFPDENFEKAVREAIDKPTGDITQSNVATVTRLDLGDLDIADLSGIEYFTGLTALFCPRNRLTELDLSQNTGLLRLWCQENQLTKLNLSQNTNLVELCCDNNTLTETGPQPKHQTGKAFLRLQLSGGAGFKPKHCADKNFLQR